MTTERPRSAAPGSSAMRDYIARFKNEPPKPRVDRRSSGSLSAGSGGVAWVAGASAAAPASPRGEDPARYTAASKAAMRRLAAANPRLHAAFIHTHRHQSPGPAPIHAGAAGRGVERAEQKTRWAVDLVQRDAEGAPGRDSRASSAARAGGRSRDSLPGDAHRPPQAAMAVAPRGGPTPPAQPRRLDFRGATPTPAADRREAPDATDASMGDALPARRPAAGLDPSLGRPTFIDLDGGRRASPWHRRAYPDPRVREGTDRRASAGPGRGRRGSSDGAAGRGAEATSARVLGEDGAGDEDMYGSGPEAVLEEETGRGRNQTHDAQSDSDSEEESDSNREARKRGVRGGEESKRGGGVAEGGARGQGAGRPNQGDIKKVAGEGDVSDDKDDEDEDNDDDKYDGRHAVASRPAEGAGGRADGTGQARDGAHGTGGAERAASGRRPSTDSEISLASRGGARAGSAGSRDASDSRAQAPLHPANGRPPAPPKPSQAAPARPVNADLGNATATVAPSAAQPRSVPSSSAPATASPSTAAEVMADVVAARRLAATATAAAASATTTAQALQAKGRGAPAAASPAKAPAPPSALKGHRVPVADPRGPAHATPGKAPAADDHESQAALQRARVAAGAVERTSAEMEAVALAVGSLVAEGPFTNVPWAFAAMAGAPPPRDLPRPTGVPSVDASARFLAEFPVSFVRAFQRRCAARARRGGKGAAERGAGKGDGRADGAEAAAALDHLPVEKVVDTLATFVKEVRSNPAGLENALTSDHSDGSLSAADVFSALGVPLTIAAVEALETSPGEELPESETDAPAAPTRHFTLDQWTSQIRTARQQMDADAHMGHLASMPLPDVARLVPATSPLATSLRDMGVPLAHHADAHAPNVPRYGLPDAGHGYAPSKSAPIVGPDGVLYDAAGVPLRGPQWSPSPAASRDPATAATAAAAAPFWRPGGGPVPPAGWHPSLRDGPTSPASHASGHAAPSHSHMPSHGYGGHGYGYDPHIPVAPMDLPPWEVAKWAGVGGDWRLMPSAPRALGGPQWAEMGMDPRWRPGPSLSEVTATIVTEMDEVMRRLSPESKGGARDTHGARMWGPLPGSRPLSSSYWHSSGSPAPPWARGVPHSANPVEREWMMRMAQLGYPPDTLAGVFGHAGPIAKDGGDAGASGSKEGGSHAHADGWTPYGALLGLASSRGDEHGGHDTAHGQFENRQEAWGGRFPAGPYYAPFTPPLSLAVAGSVGGAGAEVPASEALPGAAVRASAQQEVDKERERAIAEARGGEGTKMGRAGVEGAGHATESSRAWHLDPAAPVPVPTSSLSDEDRLALQMAMHLGWPSDGHFPIGSGVLGLGIAVGGRKEGDVQEIPVLLKTPQDLQRALYSAIPAPRAQQLGIQLNDFPAEVSRGVQAVLSGAVEQARRVFES